jgi:RimJ/RimL family protein N-acetyltransferase
MIKIKKLPNFPLPLSPEQIPNLPILYSFLENTVPNDMWVNKETSPRCFLIKSRYPSMLRHVFLLGKAEEPQLEEVDKLLQGQEPFCFVCPPEYHSFFFQRGYYLQPRVELILSGENLTPLEFEKGEVHPVTRENFHKCWWGKIMLEIYGTEEEFFKKGVGFCIPIGKDIISESYLPFVGGGWGEICVRTDQTFQNQGFSRAVSHKLITYCLSRGIKPLWSCNMENVGSLKVALNLGFTIRRYYAFLKKSTS